VIQIGSSFDAHQHPAAEITFAVEPFPPKLRPPPASVPTAR
jgi:hypothetical protein